MIKALLTIYSVLAWLTMLCTSIVITPFFLLVWILTFWWDKRRLATHMMGTFWAWHYQSLIIFWRLKLSGRKKIPWNRPLVMVANHRSLVDILALYKIRRSFKWVSKAENFKLPFIGWVLSLSNCIRVDRGSMRSGMQFMSQAEKEIAKGNSVLLFPEGTRSRKAEMRSFMDGAFVLAKKAGIGIMPVVHIGTEKTFREGKGSWILKGWAKINIQVLDEIPAAEVQELSVEDLKARVRSLMEEGISILEAS